MARRLAHPRTEGPKAKLHARGPKSSVLPCPTHPPNNFNMPASKVEPSALTIKQHFSGEVPDRKLCNSELKMLRAQEVRLLDTEWILERKRAEEKERHDISRRAALRAGRRAIEEQRQDRWRWLQDKLQAEEDERYKLPMSARSTSSSCSSHSSSATLEALPPLPLHAPPNERLPAAPTPTQSPPPSSPSNPVQRRGGSPKKKKRLPHETLSVASQCRVHGVGLSTAITRQPTSFVIEASKASGERQRTGGDAFAVAIHGKAMVTSKVCPAQSRD